MFVTGLVLAAGGSMRLGEAKQLLAYRGRTLLDATLDVARAVRFDQLGALHGDNAVWKLLHSGRFPVAELPVDGPVPIDVDTRDDYERVLAES